MRPATPTVVGWHLGGRSRASSEWTAGGSGHSGCYVSLALRKSCTNVCEGHCKRLAPAEGERKRLKAHTHTQIYIYFYILRGYICNLVHNGDFQHAKQLSRKMAIYPQNVKYFIFVASVPPQNV